jgi:hypothetical protein
MIARCNSFFAGRFVGGLDIDSIKVIPAMFWDDTNGPDWKQATRGGDWSAEIPLVQSV